MTAEPVEDELQVRLPVFEGPLDLLLYLIKKDEVDIYDIPIERITKQYLTMLELMKMLRLDLAGEFIVMAATLIYIKSRTLLPADQQQQEEEIDEPDPRLELVRQLVEYKKFKDAAQDLALKEVERERVFTRVPVEPVEQEQVSVPIREVGIFDLLTAFQKVLDRANRQEDLREIFEDRWTVSDKIKSISEAIDQAGRLPFVALFTEGAARTEIVVTFLAVLELMRLKRIRAIQDEMFGEIWVERVEDAQVRS